MFQSIITTTDTTIQAVPAMICLGAAVVFGVIIALLYMFTSKKNSYHKDFVVAIALLPVIVATVIMLIGSSTARALSLAGAFALVRFRSAPGSGKDIAVVFFVMAMGLACGLGYILFGAIAAVIVCVLLLVLCKTKFGESKNTEKQLKISIPENLNYNGIFDDLFQEYTTSCKLKNVKTTNMGSLFELTYIVNVKDETKEKDFIDALRCRNGNLNISLGMVPDKNNTIL